MSKSNDPAFPHTKVTVVVDEKGQQTGGGVWDMTGLTKLEFACIELRVPKTGDPELDAIIREARLADFAGLAMQGLLANPAFAGRGAPAGTWVELTAIEHAVTVATALIAELEKQNGR